MKKSHRFLRKNLLKISAFLIAVMVFGISVLQGTSSVYADSGPGDYQSRACKTGICWSPRTRGAYWVRVPVSRDGVAISSLGFYYVFTDATVDCWTGDPSTSYVYVLTHRLSNGQPAGMIGMKDVTSKGGTIHSAGAEDKAPAGGVTISPNDAWNAFQLHADDHFKESGQKYEQPGSSSTNLAYFCHVPTKSSKKKTTSIPTDERNVECQADRTRQKGDTRTRIAIQNMSLDGTYNPTDRNGNVVIWKANGSRSGITSDSNVTRGGASVYTLAKPGDSIRFYHSICMGVRYGQWTPTQGSWTSQESHSREYTPLPANHMEIGATPSNYVFEKVSVWNNFQNQVRTVTTHNNLFSSAGAGSKVNSIRDTIDIINPTPGNKTYTCNEISWYASRDPFIAGGYHIPGFKSGSCSSASKTGISQATGTEIKQWHKFNALRMWEIRSHTIVNSCGCGSHGARLVGNYQAAHYDNAWQGSILGNRYEYYCEDEGKTTLDCAWSCDVMGEYGCISGSYKKVQYHYSSRSFDFMYNSTHEGENEYHTKTATAYVPYNFSTSVKSSIDGGDVTFQGAAIDTSYDWKVKKRKNDKTAPGWSDGYATSTPDTGRANETHVVMFEWLYYPGEQNVTGNEFSKKGPKAYYNSGMVNGSYHVINEIVGDQNPKGKYSGQSHTEAHVRTIPDNDEYIGYKYCTAIAIYPSDSHNSHTANGLDIQKSYGENGAMDAGERWNISGASCRTIAKKPNVQIWNGSLYTEGNINTSVTRKWTNTKMRNEEYNGSKTDFFGSWTDYAIVANGKNKTMASGAVLGYNNGRYDLGGEGGKDSNSTTSQTLNPETIANNSSPTGKSKVNADASFKQNLSRLDARYKTKASTLISEIGRTSGKTIYTTPTGMQVANVYSDVKISELGIVKGNHPNKNTITNSGSGGAISGGSLVKTLGDGTNDNTLVIVSSGTVTIDRDICYGSCGDDATRLRDYSYGTSTKKSAELPQVLIFANNIQIEEQVTRVDAWLIAPNGTVNTCAGHKIGEDSSTRKGVYARDASDYHYTNGRCGLTLVVNGPVFAHHMELLRTAGAFHGYADTTSKNVLDRSIGATGRSDDKKKGSTAPAEIFNLRSDVYIWAYNQAQRYSEAVVTYTRELAPRY